MRLLLLRHGQTPSNVSGLLDTAAPGPGLTELGTRQAAAVPGALDGVPIDAIVVSSLTRTTLTAAPLAHQRALPAMRIDGLREIEAGRLELAADSDAHRTYLGTAFGWARGDLDRRIPGGPDGHQFLRRFDAALATVAAQGWHTVVAVSHGAAIRAWASARVAGVDLDEVASTPLANTGLFEIDGDQTRGWQMVRWNPDPIGGQELATTHAGDPTGEPAGHRPTPR